MDTVEVMSNHSAPYLTQTFEAPLSPPREYRRGRSYTSIRPNPSTRRIVKQPSPTTSDHVLHSISKQRLSTTSSEGSTHEPETMEEKWKKLKEMMTAVESMKSIVECLFPAVETPESHINYNTSQYEVEVQLLKRTIDEQLHRMKVYFCEHQPQDNPRYEVEEMRLNIESNFKRMKVVIDGLIPSVNGQDLTKFRLDQIRNQISTIERTVKQLAEARKSTLQYQRNRSNTIDSPTNFQSQTASIRFSYSESRIKDLEQELEASLDREEALRARIKKLEEGNDSEVAKMEEQHKLLCQILDKANLRANKAKNEAFELESKVAELTEELMTKEYKLGVSMGKIAELESKIADMRSCEVRTQIRRPPDTFNTYRNTENGYSSNVNTIKEQAPPIRKVPSPRSIPLRRQRNVSTTSQRSNEGSPLRERRQVPFGQTSPVLDYMPTLKEYNHFANMESQRYMTMA